MPLTRLAGLYRVTKIDYDDQKEKNAPFFRSNTVPELSEMSEMTTIFHMSTMTFSSRSEAE